VAAPFHVQRKTPELKQPKWMDRRYKEALATASLAVSNNHCNCNCNGTAATPTAEAAPAAAAATPSATATHDGRLSMIQSSAERADGRTCGAVVEKQEFRSQIRFKQTVSQSTPPSKAKLAQIQSVGKA